MPGTEADKMAALASDRAFDVRARAACAERVLASWGVRAGSDLVSLRFEIMSSVRAKGDCWESNRASVNIRGHRVGVQDAAYVLFKAAIPQGSAVVPSCGNKRCVWVGHLAAVPVKHSAPAA